MLMIILPPPPPPPHPHPPPPPPRPLPPPPTTPPPHPHPLHHHPSPNPPPNPLTPPSTTLTYRSWEEQLSFLISVFDCVVMAHSQQKHYQNKCTHSWVQYGGPVTTESIVRFDTWFELFEVFRKKLAPSRKWRRNLWEASIQNGRRRPYWKCDLKTNWILKLCFPANFAMENPFLASFLYFDQSNHQNSRWPPVAIMKM